MYVLNVVGLGTTGLNALVGCGTVGIVGVDGATGRKRVGTGLTFGKVKRNPPIPGLNGGAGGGVCNLGVDGRGPDGVVIRDGSGVGVRVPGLIV